jgi:hypothetical protein
MRKKNYDANNAVVKLEHKESLNVATETLRAEHKQTEDETEAGWQEEKAEWVRDRQKMSATIKEMGARIVSLEARLSLLEDVVDRVQRVTGVDSPTGYTRDELKRWENDLADQMLLAVGATQDAITAMVTIMTRHPRLVTAGVIGCVTEKVPNERMPDH